MMKLLKFPRNRKKTSQKKKVRPASTEEPLSTKTPGEKKGVRKETGQEASS